MKKKVKILLKPFLRTKVSPQQQKEPIFFFSPRIPYSRKKNLEFFWAPITKKKKKK